MNEHEPTETPDEAQKHKMEEDDIAEMLAPSEDEDAGIADFHMVNAFIAAGVDLTCAELYT